MAWVIVLVVAIVIVIPVFVLMTGGAIAALESNLIVAATSYGSVNAQAALNQLASLGATPAQTLQANLDRTVNQARGLFGSLFSNPVSARNAYCDAHT